MAVACRIPRFPMNRVVHWLEDTAHGAAAHAAHHWGSVCPLTGASSGGLPAGDPGLRGSAAGPDQPRQG